MVLMGLGPFRFSVSTYAYEELERTVEARWESVNLIGRAPAHQFLGAGDETVALHSTFFPHFVGGRGLEQLSALEQATRNGQRLMMASANRAFGNHAIRRISNRQSFFRQNGEAQKIEIDMELVRYGGAVSTGGGVSSLLRLFG